MTEFEAFDQSVEVSGRLVDSVVDTVSDLSNVYESRSERILAREGIGDPEPGEWYPQQDWLDAFDEITTMVGRETTRRLGQEFATDVDWPAEMRSVCEAVALVDRYQEANHRGGEHGEYRCQPAGDRATKVIARTPAPCAYDRGVLKGLVGELVTDPDVEIREAGSCRADGDDECWYHLTW